MKSKNLSKTLSVFSLVMINVIAVDNLRSLPASAEYGFSLVFYYLLSALLFMVPTALVSAELATGWPQYRRNVYLDQRSVWQKNGFHALWLLWIYNVSGFPPY